MATTSASTPSPTTSTPTRAARHLVGFKSALTRTINGYAERGGLWKDLKETPTGDDAREGLAAVISIKLPSPQFEGQTKTKLGNTEVKGLVEQMVNEQLATWLEENPTGGEEDRRQDRRRHPGPHRRPQGARDGAPQGRARRHVAARASWPTARARDPSESELYIVEGDSAGGSAKQGRDRRNQAILPLRGKILNVEKARFEKMLTSQEIVTLITALGHRHRQGGLRPGQVPLPPDHPHDRRGRGRQPHPHAAAHVLLPADAGADRHAATSTSPSRRSTKSTRGKKELYLKDERGARRAPACASASDRCAVVPSEPDGVTELRGRTSAALLEAIRQYEERLGKLARRRDPRILDALVQAARVDETTLLDMDRLEAEVEKMHAWLKDRYPEVLAQLRSFRKDDPEHQAKKLVFRTEVNGSPKETVLDHAFLSSPEYAELLTLRRDVRAARARRPGR